MKILRHRIGQKWTQKTIAEAKLENYGVVINLQGYVHFSLNSSQPDSKVRETHSVHLTLNEMDELVKFWNENKPKETAE